MQEISIPELYNFSEPSLKEEKLNDPDRDFMTLEEARLGTDQQKQELYLYNQIFVHQYY